MDIGERSSPSPYPLPLPSSPRQHFLGVVVGYYNGAKIFQRVRHDDHDDQAGVLSRLQAAEHL